MNFSSLQDEYDDFGRKKKKKNKGPGAVSGGRDSGSNGWGGTKKKVKDAEVLHSAKEIKRPREFFPWNNKFRQIFAIAILSRCRY